MGRLMGICPWAVFFSKSIHATYIRDTFSFLFINARNQNALHR